MSTKSKVIFKLSLLIAVLFATLFAGFSILGTGKNHNTNNDVLKTNSVNAASGTTLYKDWISKLVSYSDKSNIESLTFTNQASDIPTDNLVKDAISVGASNDTGTTYDSNSNILAYLQRGSNYYSYNVIVYSQNIIYTPIDCTGFFSGFGSSSGRYIAFNLKNFNTSKTLNMSSMFSNSYFLGLDFSNCNFNTENVTNMSNMFNNFRIYSDKLDLSGFNTSNVTNMSGMFQRFYMYSNGISTINAVVSAVSNATANQLVFGNSFITSNCRNFSQMFSGTSTYYPSYFNSVDLSRFALKTSEKYTENEIEYDLKIDLSNMFAYCTNLTNVSFTTSFNTLRVTDMSGMFDCCRQLKNLDLSKAIFNTENVENMSRMFRASVFENIGVNNNETGLNFGAQFKITKVKDLSNMFSYYYYSSYYYPSCKTINLSNWKTPTSAIENFNVSFAYMFNYCIYLKSVNFGNNFQVDNVTNMTNMFAECNEVTDIKFGNKFIPYAVTDFSKIFMGCVSIVGMDLTYFKTSSATNMSYMFYNCYSLTSLDLRAFNTSKVTNMSFMFAVDSKSTSRLSNLTLNFNTGNVENMSNMFQYCQGLTSLELSSFNTSKVTNMSYMFDSCIGLSSVGANNTLQPYALNFGNNFYTSNVTNMAYMFNNCSRSTIFDLSLFDTQKVTNMAYLFQNCNNAKRIILGSKFLTNNVTNMKYMFANCSSLKFDLDLTLFSTEKITSTEKMFYNCSSVPHILLGASFTIENVTDMQYMFCGCNSLEELDISRFNTANVTDMKYLFSNCATLKELDLKSFDTSKVTTMWNMFSGCSSLKTAGVCNVLKTYDLNFGDNFDTSLVTDMSNMFAFCQGLEIIELGNKFSTANVENCSNMFFNCSSVRDLQTISNFNTNKLKDMSSMFGFCSSLNSIDLRRFTIKSGTVIIGLLDACSSLDTIIAPTIERGSKITADLPTMFVYNSMYTPELSENTNGRTLTRAGIYLYSSFRSILTEEVCQKIASLTTTNNLTRSELTKDRYSTLELLQEAAGDNIYSVGTGNTSGTLYNNTSPLKAYLVKSEHVDEYGEELFDCIIYCPNQLNIYAPTSCVSLFAGNDDYGSFFTNLLYVYLDNFNSSFTTSMNKMFYNCGKLLSLKINNINVSSDTTFEDMLDGCDNLAYIHTFNIPSGSSENIILPGIYYDVSGNNNQTYDIFPTNSKELSKKYLLKLDLTGTDGVSSLPTSWDFNEEENYVSKLYYFNQSIGILPKAQLGHRVFDDWGTLDDNGEFNPFTLKTYNLIYDLTLIPSWKKIYINFDYNAGKNDSVNVGYFTTKTVEIQNDDGTTTSVIKPKIDLQEIPDDWADKFVDDKMYVYVGDEFGLLPNAKFSFIFDGWYLNNNYVKSTDLIPSSNEDKILLIAKWTEDANEEDKVTITFNANGGTIDFRNGVLISLKQREEVNKDGESIVVNYVEIEVVKCSINWTSGETKAIAIVDTVKDISYDYMPNVSYRKHKFLGWFTEQFGGRQVYSNEIINADITLYAQWEELEDPIKANAQLLIYVLSGLIVIIGTALFFAFTRKARASNKSVTVNEKFINEYNNNQNDSKSQDEMEDNDKK